MDDLLHDFLIWLLQFGAIAVTLLVVVHLLFRERPDDRDRPPTPARVPDPPDPPAHFEDGGGPQ